ncbi:heterokaryon incompatibility protein-domain-containing protein [Hypomontagnella monticulosa]|nr:heterokaryon incompatibility protein-domain-containing protein [Hypomontagnella monticulosa]
MSIYICRTYSDSERGLVSWVYLTRSRKGFSDGKRLCLSHGLAVWADKDSFAAKHCEITTERPIFTNEPAEAAPLFRKWLQECVSQHPKCRRTIAGHSICDEGASILPTRILSVQGDSDSDVRLLESSGLRGRYCILSYCWGEPSRHPPKTTTDNLCNHLVGIRFHDMPKTFRDAIMITRSLGIDYLWIDSLCIVQDDHDDWANESKLMGDYYGNATLMIGAAGAKDPTEGCFNVDRLQTPVFTAPIADKNRQVIGSFYISLLPRNHTRGTDFSPLRHRGWAAQEWYLSRRKLIFMPGGVTWACKEAELHERGSITDNALYEYNSWSLFLEFYTSAHLTFASDRLQAIQGVANALSSAHDGIYAYGLWEDELTTNLIWESSNVSSPMGDLPDVPSWSWAATRGEKYWPLSMMDGNRPMLQIEISRVNTRLLRGSGYLRLAHVQQALFDFRHIWRTLYYSLGAGFEYPDSSFLGIFEKEADCHRMGFAYGENDPFNFFGLCAFDRIPLSEVYCLFVALYNRVENDPYYTDKSPANPPDSNTARCTCQQCAFIFEMAKGRVVYWTLLLQPVSQDSWTLRRVGMGLFYLRAFNSAQTVFRNFQIV